MLARSAGASKNSSQELAENHQTVCRNENPQVVTLDPVAGDQRKHDNAGGIARLETNLKNAKNRPRWDQCCRGYRLLSFARPFESLGGDPPIPEEALREERPIAEDATAKVLGVFVGWTLRPVRANARGAGPPLSRG